MSNDEFSRFKELNKFEEYKKYNSELYHPNIEYNNVKNELSNIRETNELQNKEKDPKSDNKLADELKDKLNSSPSSAPSTSAAQSASQAMARAATTSSAASVGGSIAAAATAVVAAVSVGVVPVPGISEDIEPSPYAIELQYDDVGSNYYAFEIDPDVIKDGVNYSVKLFNDDYTREEQLTKEEPFAFFTEITPSTKYNFEVYAHLDEGKQEVAYDDVIVTKEEGYISTPIILQTMVFEEEYIAHGRALTYISDFSEDPSIKYFINVINDEYPPYDFELHPGFCEYPLEKIMDGTLTFNVYKTDGVNKTLIGTRTHEYNFDKYRPTEYNYSYDMIDASQILAERTFYGLEIKAPLNYNNYGIYSYVGKIIVTDNNGYENIDYFSEPEAIITVDNSLTKVNIRFEFYLDSFGRMDLLDSFEINDYEIPASPYEMNVNYSNSGADFIAFEINEDQFIDDLTYTARLWNGGCDKVLDIDPEIKDGVFESLIPNQTYNFGIFATDLNGEAKMVHYEKINTKDEAYIGSALLVDLHLDLYYYTASASIDTYISDLNNTEHMYEYTIRVKKDGVVIHEGYPILGKDGQYLPDIKPGTYNIELYYSDGTNEILVESRQYVLDLSKYIPTTHDTTYNPISTSDIELTKYMDSTMLGFNIDYNNNAKSNYYMYVIADGDEGYHAEQKCSDPKAYIYIDNTVKTVNIKINFVGMYFGEEIVYDTYEVGSYTIPEKVTYSKTRVDLTTTPKKFTLNSYVDALATTKLMVTDSLLGTTEEVTSNEYVKDLTDEPRTLIFFLQDKNGAKIGDDYVVDIDPTVTGSYSITPVEAKDALVTYNVDDSFNVYIDTNFSTTDPDITYLVKHKTGIFGTPSYITKEQPCDSRYVSILNVKNTCNCTYIVLKHVGNVDYILQSQAMVDDIYLETYEPLVNASFISPGGGNPDYLRIAINDTLEFDHNSVIISFTDGYNYPVPDTAFKHEITDGFYLAKVEMSVREIDTITISCSPYPKNYDALNAAITLQGSRFKTFVKGKSVV